MKMKLAALAALMTGCVNASLVDMQGDLLALGNGFIAPNNPFLIGTTTVNFVTSYGSTDRLLVVDTDVGIPADPDLQTFAGWALAIQENPNGIPDDEVLGGAISLSFPAEDGFSFSASDTEEGVQATLIHESGGVTILPSIITLNAMASPLQVLFNPADPYVGVRFDLGGSGAVSVFGFEPEEPPCDPLDSTCVPEPSSSLILGCLGFVTVLGRRKRISS